MLRRFVVVVDREPFAGPGHNGKGVVTEARLSGEGQVQR